MLDEKSLRKPTFSEGNPVELADGQTWTFPKPRLRFKPRFVDGKVEIGGGPSFGPEFDDKMDVLFGVGDVDFADRMRVKFEMACRLLRCNYELTEADLSDLVVYEPEDAAAMERWDALEQAIMGLRPKELSASTSE